MTSPKSRVEDSLLERFERLDDEVPITDEEARSVLAASGIDPDKSMKRLLSKLDRLSAKERHERFARAEIARRQELARLDNARDDRSHGELIAQLHLLQHQHPSLSAQFRNFESMNDGELRSLVAEIEELVRRARGE